MHPRCSNPQDTAPLLVATQQFLLKAKLRVPEDVSLMCGDPDPVFTWSYPEISHIRWDSGPVIRSILKWAHNISLRKEDLYLGHRSVGINTIDYWSFYILV